MVAPAGQPQGQGGAASQALTVKSTPEALTELFEQKRQQIEALLQGSPVKPAKLQQIMLSEIGKVPKLKDCDPVSLIGAAIEVARLGLQPGGTLGHVYLIPYGRTVQVIPGYKGLMELVQRGGVVQRIDAQAVHANDRFDVRFGLNPDLVHEPATGNRGPITHFYAVAFYHKGPPKFEVMAQWEVDAIRDGSSGYKAAKKYNSESPWDTHYTEMGRKTAIRRLCKTLPMSIELQQFTQMDDLSNDGGVKTFNADFTEATVTDVETTTRGTDGAVVDVGTGEIVQDSPEWAMTAALWEKTKEQAKAAGIDDEEFTGLMQTCDCPVLARDMKQPEYEKLSAAIAAKTPAAANQGGPKW